MHVRSQVMQEFQNLELQHFCVSCLLGKTSAIRNGKTEVLAKPDVS